MNVQNESDQIKFGRSARLELVREVLPEALRQATVLALLEISLAEDLSPEGWAGVTVRPFQKDVTSAATLPPGKSLRGNIFAKVPGIVAGLPLAEAVFKFVDPSCNFRYQVAEGDRVEAGQSLARVDGPGAGLLAAERTALNFLGRLSGIASLTRKFVDAVAGSGAVILDTRKTAPGFRTLDKYAVRLGGGQNHRLGLYDMVLIKNNHIDGAGGIEAAVAQAREMYDDRYPIEVEVRTLSELQSALALHPTRIMLDNMDLDTMRRAVEISGGRVPLEASGNVNLNTVKEIAGTGVDYISVGSLTHSAPAMDVSMHIESLQGR